jgi:hypothetical protein
MIDPSRARRILAGTAASVFAIAGAAGTTVVLGTAPALAASHSAAHGAAHGALRPAVSVQVNRVSGGTGAGAVRAAAVTRTPGHKVIVNCFAGRRVADQHRTPKFCLHPHWGR